MVSRLLVGSAIQASLSRSTRRRYQWTAESIVSFKTANRPGFPQILGFRSNSSSLGVAPLIFNSRPHSKLKVADTTLLIVSSRLYYSGLKHSKSKRTKPKLGSTIPNGKCLTFFYISLITWITVASQVRTTAFGRVFNILTSQSSTMIQLSLQIAYNMLKTSILLSWKRRFRRRNSQNIATGPQNSTLLILLSMVTPAWPVCGIFLTRGPKRTVVHSIPTL